MLSRDPRGQARGSVTRLCVSTETRRAGQAQGWATPIGGHCVAQRLPHTPALDALNREPQPPGAAQCVSHTHPVATARDPRTARGSVTDSVQPSRRAVT